MNGNVYGEMERAILKRWEGTGVPRRRSLASWFGWYGIPASLGVFCLALVQLRRTLKREETVPASTHPVTWQVRLHLYGNRRGSRMVDTCVGGLDTVMLVILCSCIDLICNDLCWK